MASPAPRHPKLPALADVEALWIVDLSGYIFRAYHAVAPLSSPSGEPTHAVHGTVSMLQRLVEAFAPANFVVCMDSKAPSFRKDLLATYKANRPPAPPDLSSQITRCEQIARAFGWCVLQSEGVEADDLIATSAKWALAHGLRVVVVSADKDLLQLVHDDDDRVVLYDPSKDKVVDAAGVVEKYGVKPSALGDWLALVGDSSDNVPGVAGVGPKTATELLLQYGNIQEIIAAAPSIKKEKLRASLVAAVETLPLSRRLVALHDTVPIAISREEVHRGAPRLEELRALFTELGLTRHLAQLPKAERGAAEGVEVGASGPAAEAPQPLRVVDLEEAIAMISQEEALALAPCAMGASPDVTLVGVALRGAWASLYLPVAHRALGAPPVLDASSRERLARAIGARAAATTIVFDRAAIDALVGYAAGRNVDDAQLLSYLADPDAPRTREALAELARVALPEPSVTKKKTAPEPLDLEPVEVTATRASAEAASLFAVAPRLRERVAAAGVTRVLDEVDRPLRAVLSAMEERGVGIDTVELGRQAASARAALAELEARAERIVGKPLSLRSRNQLEAVFFDDLGLPVLKKTPKGGRSIDAEVLEELAEKHELPRVVLEHRELDKLLGTYLEALPTYVNARTGRIHPRFDQTNTATGRLACHDPNLQNVPIRTELGRRVRDAFVAQPGKVILSADYSQIELRVLAHLSGDEALIDAFASGHDIHRATAAKMYGLAPEQVSNEQRRSAKAINFGVLYGMGDWALGRQLGIARDEAQRFIASYFAAYPNVSGWLEGVVAKARDEGAVRTLDGRVRFLPNLRSTNRVLRAEAERMAKNSPIQGTSADILKRAMIALEANPAPGAAMILTVHDELVFEVDESSAERAAAHVKALMEDTVRLRVPLDVQAGFGPHWGAAHR
jgi:DNA polymerase-1